MNLQALLPKALELITQFGFKLIIAIVILVVGRFIARMIQKLMRRMMVRAEVDETIISFTGNLTYFALLAIVIIAAMSQVGIQTTSFIAVLGAAGLAIGLALQGSLSNFASGVMIIIFRPFKLGDYVEAGGTSGTVENIHIFNTTLNTPDNKVIIIPNSNVTSGNITNYSAKDTRRVDMIAGCGYNDNLDQVKKVLAEILENDERILKDPAYTIAVMELADSSVNFAVRPWVKSQDYWNVKFDVTETIKKRFDQEGINIPFPQQDVHIYKHEG